MKTIKLLTYLLLITAIIFIPAASLPSAAEAVMPLNLHTLHTVTSFGFIDGHARVNVDFTGYEETARLRVDVLIEKHVLAFFRRKVVAETYYAQGESYQNEFFYPIDKNGTYDCTVTYTVTNGSEDLITFKDTQSYQLSEHTEHTHIWTQSRVEPTCTSEGADTRSCYCGETETVVLEKLQHTWTHNRVEPTCQHIGWDTRTCYCGKTETFILEKLQHTWTQNRVEPTCQSTGLNTLICYCGATETVVLERLPHTPGKTDRVWLSSTNYTEKYYCTDCNTLISEQNFTVIEAANRQQDYTKNLLDDFYYGSNAFQSKCNCPSCMLQDAFSATEAAKPKFPSSPRISTTDPWRKQQEAYNKLLNPYHINK